MNLIYKVCVCASGGGGNFQALIDNQDTYSYLINLLVSDRECKAKERAIQHGIPTVTINKITLGDFFFDHLDQSIPADTNLIVLAGFFPIISPEFCKKWEGKIINTHPSLLPKYGGKGMYGVKVQEEVLRNREQFAGCTVHHVNEEIDGGEIILQKKISVIPGESAWELGGRIFLEENKLLPEAIKVLMNR